MVPVKRSGLFLQCLIAHKHCLKGAEKVEVGRQPFLSFVTAVAILAERSAPNAKERHSAALFFAIK